MTAMAPDTKPRTRRTEGVRVKGRAARVVTDVLIATAEELSRVGYAALRVEDVALRSGVNKTTIYRRWPTKPELVGAALRAVWEPPDVPDTGSVRGDFIASLSRTAAFAMSPIGKGLTHVIQLERAHPEVEPITRSLREDYRKLREQLVDRAIERGELAPGTDSRFVTDLISAPIFSRLFTDGESVDATFIETVVDVVLTGMRERGRT
ncbi:MAG TPA: TetR/AcrR family transcriptional regulator [Polyangiaceae bacterium]|nr:TetR/AcrR family transcriptional regulator [Polyangiaceae bacterium]